VIALTQPALEAVTENIDVSMQEMPSVVALRTGLAS
jgi:hypothetical protein